MVLPFSEVATTSLYNRSKKIAPNVLNNNAVLFKLNKIGNVKKNETGREILREFDFAQNPSFKRYRGQELLSTAQTSVLSAYRFPWAQSAVAVIMNGLEEIQNDGAEQSIKWLAARMKNAESTIKNMTNGDIMSDGTLDGGKQIAGLDILIAEDPTLGEVGGVTRSTNAVAQNFSFDTTADGTGDFSVGNAEDYMLRTQIETTREGDMNRMWVLGNTYYRIASEAVSSRQRFVDQDKELADLGFTNFKVHGITCVLGGGYRSSAGSAAVGMDATKGWLMNLDYIELVTAKGRFFQPLAQRDAVNQDAYIKYLVFAGQMVCSEFGLQAVVFDQ